MGRPFPEAERALALDTSVLAPPAAERLGRTESASVLTLRPQDPERSR